MNTVYIHINNEEGVVAEMEDIPDPKDQFVKAMNPRKRDGKELHYVSEGVRTILIPWWRITFIEVMPSGQEEEVFTFIRD